MNILRFKQNSSTSQRRSSYLFHERNLFYLHERSSTFLFIVRRSYLFQERNPFCFKNKVHFFFQERERSLLCFLIESSLKSVNLIITLIAARSLQPRLQAYCEMAQLLLDAGAVEDVRGGDIRESPLLNVVQSRRNDVVSLLLKYRADPTYVFQQQREGWIVSCSILFFSSSFCAIENECSVITQTNNVKVTGKILSWGGRCFSQRVDRDSSWKCLLTLLKSQPPCLWLLRSSEQKCNHGLL